MGVPYWIVSFHDCGLENKTSLGDETENLPVTYASSIIRWENSGGFRNKVNNNKMDNDVRILLIFWTAFRILTHVWRLSKRGSERIIMRERGILAYAKRNSELTHHSNITHAEEFYKLLH